MVARFLFVLPGLLTLGVCPGIAQSTLTGPTLGLFFDPKAHVIRPIWGIPGSATAGQPMDVGFPLAAGIISPSQDYALVVSGDGSMSAITFAPNGPSAQPISGIAGAPDRMVTSPGGKSAALYYSNSASALILTGLPNSPQMARQVDLSTLPNAPDVIAISDDGSLLLVGVCENADGSPAQGEVFLYTPDATAPRSIASVQHVSALAFLAQSHDALLADDVANSVTLVSDVANGANVAWAFTSQQLLAPDFDGGLSRRLTHGSVGNAIPSWSHDGKWIYFSSGRTGRTEIWKLPSSGGAGVQVTRNGGHTAFESPDGKTLYYTKDETSKLWRSRVDGSGESVIADGVVFRGFVVTANRIYYLRGEPGGATALRDMSLATGKDAQITTFAKPLELGLSVSPDGMYVLYTQIDHLGSNLMLVEDFH